MKISLVLATVGRTAEVSRCLRSLAVQTDPCFEVLLVDQNQDDRLLPVVQEATSLASRLVHVRMAIPNLSRARNWGVARSSGDVIGMTDDDCWYDPDAIAEVRAAFLRDPLLDGVVARWSEQAQARTGRPANGLLVLDDWRCFRGGDASSISLFFKKNLWVRLGGMDERLGIGQWYGAGEETDLVLRALTASAKLAQCPAAQVHHPFAQGSPDTTPKACHDARCRARGTGAVYGKHGLSLWVVLRGLVAPWLVPVLCGRLQQSRRGLWIALGRLEGWVRWKLQGF